MDIRYTIAPQMKEYDKITQKWIPYLMYFHSPCYSSAVVLGWADGDFDIGNIVDN